MDNLIFDAYASYYDLLYRDKNYGAETAYVASLLEKHGVPRRSVLELGCGTGGHAEHLARSGYEVHGVDLSERMLARAFERRNRSDKAVAARLSFGPGDVRNVRLDRKFDTVLALFNVMGYQVTDDDLRATFMTAAAHLHPGGVFLFDFWYGPSVEIDPPVTRVKRMENDAWRIVRVAEPTVHHDENVIEIDFTIFVQERAKGAIERLDELHRVRYFSVPELRRFASPHFVEVDSHVWMGDAPLHSGDWNGVQILRRK